MKLREVDFGAVIGIMSMGFLCTLFPPIDNWDVWLKVAGLSTGWLVYSIFLRDIK